jgi:uncharacterized protein (TIGR02246 family)
MSSPRNPEEWPRAFTRHLNAGELDAVVALYEPDANFVQRSGELLVGREKIRPVLAGLIRAKTQFEDGVVRAMTVGEIAVLYTDFRGSMLDASGARVAIASRAIEVLRRQPDGSWKLIVGDPNARG